MKNTFRARVIFIDKGTQRVHVQPLSLDSDFRNAVQLRFNLERTPHLKDLQPGDEVLFEKFPQGAASRDCSTPGIPVSIKTDMSSPAWPGLSVKSITRAPS